MTRRIKSNSQQIQLLTLEFCNVKDKDKDKAREISNEIISLLTPMVYFNTHKITPNGRHFKEIWTTVQEGIFYALLKYDPSSSALFTTYAIKWSYFYASNIYKLLKCRTSHLAQAQVSFAYSYWRKFHLDGTDEEFLNTVGKSQFPSYKRTKSLSQYFGRTTVSLPERRLGKVYEGFNDVVKKDYCATLRELMDKIPTDREKVILSRALSGETLRDIGKDFKLTPERTRQIRDRAVKRIRDYLQGTGKLEQYRELLED